MYSGASIEAKSSYLANEILWGHKFEPMVSYNKYIDCYEIDWSKFDTTSLAHRIQNTTEFKDISESQESRLLENDGDYLVDTCELENGELESSYPKTSTSHNRIISLGEREISL